MKGIIIKDCLNCPYSCIEDSKNNGGKVVCELGKSIEIDTEVICRMVDGNFNIPAWCRLDDLQDMVDKAAVERYIQRSTTRCPGCGSTEYFNQNSMKLKIYSIRFLNARNVMRDGGLIKKWE